MVLRIAGDIYSIFAPATDLWVQPGFWMTIVIIGTVSLFIGFRVWVSLLFTPIISFLASDIEIPDTDWAVLAYFLKAVQSLHATWIITVLLYFLDKAVRKHNRKKYRQRLRQRRRNRAHRQIASHQVSE